MSTPSTSRVGLGAKLTAALAGVAVVACVLTAILLIQRAGRPAATASRTDQQSDTGAPTSATATPTATATATPTATGASGDGVSTANPVDRCGSSLSTLPNERPNADGNDVSTVAFDASPTPAQEQAASDFARTALEAGTRFEDPEAAKRAGYTVSELDQLRATIPPEEIEAFELGIDPGAIDHWFNEELANDGIAADPTKPDALMYATDGERYVLAGLLFVAPLCQHGPQFGGPMTVWHNHDALACYEGAAPVSLPQGYRVGIPLAEQQGLRCDRGDLLSISPEMLHVWKGADSLADTFEASMSASWALDNLG